MANELNKLYPHAEDVIFNRPSLKELVRLIKNGTIHAIWPSTLQEFTDWNESGYIPYIDAAAGRTEETLKLKSQKTAMTIYYGDNEDDSSSKTLNLAKTQERYNELVSSIDQYKTILVENGFYDDTSDIYPKELIMSLNQADGSINNSQEIIEYKNTLEAEYQSYVDKLVELKERVDNFKPIIEGTSYVLSDSKLKQDYEQFFPETLAEVKLLFSNATEIPQKLTDEEIQHALINENGQYDFQLINNLCDDKILIINNINDYIQNYFLLDENIMTTVKNSANLLKALQQHWLEKRTELIITYNDFYDSYYQVLDEGYYKELEEYTLPTITSNIFTESEKQVYTNDFNLFFTDDNSYITNYKQHLILAYMLSKFHEKDGNIELLQTSALKYWEQIVSTIQSQLDETISLEEKIDYINQILAQEFIIFIKNFTPPQLVLYSLYFLPDGDFDNSTLIVNEFNYVMNFLNILNQNLNFYFKDQSENNLMIDMELFNTAYSNYLSLQNSLLSLNEDGKNQIIIGQEEVINLYQNFENDYINFIVELSNLDIPATEFTPFEIDNENLTILNKIDMENSIIEHQTKLCKFYDVIIDLFKEEKTTSEYYRFKLETQGLIQRLDEAKIISSDFGNQELSQELLLSDDYNMETLSLLLERITNNNETLINNNQLNESSNLIPEVSLDGMEIENAETISKNLQKILDTGVGRLNWLSKQLNEINALLRYWSPAYDSTAVSHYTCIAVGSDIQFDNKINNPDGNALTADQIDGSLTIIVDGQYNYPLINNLADSINSTTRNSQILTVGGLASLFGSGGSEDESGLTSHTVGSTYIPVHIQNGQFTPCAGVISGNYSEDTTKGDVTYWEVIHPNVGNVIGLQATKLFGAVYNDYAEYRSAEAKPGRCIVEKGDGTLTPSTARLQLGANIVSDTYGFAIGETNDATCPVAVCGRVLVYPLEAKELYTPGAAVCSGPDGTVSLMTREEIKEWPDAIVGYVSEIPTYDTWGTDNVPVDGRIWIKIK